MKPTHKYTAVLRDPASGKRSRAANIKFNLVKPNSPEISAKIRLRETFPSHSHCEIESIVVSELPTPVKKVKINDQHDFITLTAQFPDGKMVVTTGRSRKKMSGDILDLPSVRDIFAKFNKIDGDRSPKAAIETFHFLAVSSKTLAEFSERALALP